MLFRAYCATCVGLEVIPVVVEVSVQPGVGIFLVGLPDSAVKESLLRVTTALRSCGYRVPGRKVVINLAPANIRKEGSGYDVAIALGLLAASGQISPPDIQDFLIMGELALDGSLRGVHGVLPVALKGAELGFRRCIFPVDSSVEAAQVEGVKVFGAERLSDVVDIVSGADGIERLVVDREPRKVQSGMLGADFMDVMGQDFAKRGLEIAASGAHNLILSGPPGSGKSFMASCLASILPPMDKQESLETSAIYSVAGLLTGNGGLVTQRPFRTPHNTSSVVAMVGGGPNASPGEISLAHNGVLYLDEISLFSPTTLDLLRQPLEERSISISRARYKVTYPASFMLVGSMNPCPCGYLGEQGDKCTCTPGMIARYQAKISGPLLDRIDLNIKVKPVDKCALVRSARGESSSDIARRVAAAREIQRLRFKGSGIFTNSQMDARQLQEYCPLGESQKRFMESVMEKFSLSARGYSRILRVSRTIADMAGEENISAAHISEAVQYRFRDFL